MAERVPNLIYDLGLHTGGDTAYYLSRGYNVLAVDANPVMVEEARSRFQDEVREKRLTLLNVGIAEAPETATFWVSDHSDWSSFNREIASRDGVGHRAIPVPVVTLAILLEEYGVPHYLKIDIEGNDSQCVEALKGTELPKYISVEAECVGDSDQLSDSEATGILSLLHDVGYRKFKLVDQRQRWRSVRSTKVARFWNRVLDSISYGRLRAVGLSSLTTRFTDYGHVASLGFDFSSGSSGPWGEDVPGKWMGFEAARSA